MAYKNLSELTTSGQTWNIKVKVIRMWDSINPSTHELISIDMILMDDQVFLYRFYTRLLLLSLLLLRFSFPLFSRVIQCTLLYGRI
jgi:hypothetical protein